MIYSDSTASGLEHGTQPMGRFDTSRSPRDTLKFILTKWYSPETSALIAGKCPALLKPIASTFWIDSISARCTETQLKKLIAGPLRDIMRFAEKHFTELNI